MRLKIGSGQLKEWFEKANEEELILMYLMNPRSIHSLCVLLECVLFQFSLQENGLGIIFKILEFIELINHHILRFRHWGRRVAVGNHVSNCDFSVR